MEEIAPRPLKPYEREILELRRELEEIRKIEASDEVLGWMYAHGSNGEILVAGEFSSGKEFRAKYKVKDSDRPAWLGLSEIRDLIVAEFNIPRDLATLISQAIAMASAEKGKRLRAQAETNTNQGEPS